MAEVPSFYYEVLSEYKRTGSHVIEVVGNPSSATRIARLVVSCFLNTGSWEDARPTLTAQLDDSARGDELSLHTIAVRNSTRSVLVWETAYDSHIVGVVFLASDTCSPHQNPARESFARTLLHQDWAASRPLPRLFGTMQSERVAAICRTFEEDLLCRAPQDDLWEDFGKRIFWERVSYYVLRSIPVQFCLPAFPCKSTNPNKTASALPDGAEYEALTALHAFCEKVRQLYAPGCVIDIVSNGHVFSDCIGADDVAVTQYTVALRQMMERISGHDKGDGYVRFHSLASILHHNPHDSHPREEYPPVFHPVTTETTSFDDECRAMLLATCRASAKDVQYVIKTKPDHPLTALYRGFSRFMCEDLRAVKSVKDLSGKQRVKVASRAGLEMIQRNKAYSHLVERAMPTHVRLSIHAYDNRGPKFAVCLLPPRKFQVTAAILSDPDISSSSSPSQATKSNAEIVKYQAKNHLHIPTPWHGVLVEVEDLTDKVFVCKAGTVRAELEREDSVWAASSGYVADHPRGGRFVLRRKQPREKEDC